MSSLTLLWGGSALFHAAKGLKRQSNESSFIIEKNYPPHEFQTDIHIFLVDREINPLDPIFESSKVILVHPDSGASGVNLKKCRNTPDVPIFTLDLNDTNADGWREFWDYLKELFKGVDAT